MTALEQGPIDPKKSCRRCGWSGPLGVEHRCESLPSNERNDLLEKAVNFLRSFGGAHHPEAMAIDELRVALSQLEVRYERMRSHWEEACKQIGRPAVETESEPCICPYCGEPHGRGPSKTTTSLEQP